MKEIFLKFENTLLLLVILLSYTFLGYAYYITTDATIRGVILGAVVASLNTVMQWRFGSSKSSANKDAIIGKMQEDATTIKTDTTTVQNAEVVNSENTTIK